MSSALNKQVIEMAQAAIATSIQNDPVLADHSKQSKISRLIQAGSARLILTAAVAAAAFASTAGINQAHAQQWSPYATTQYAQTQQDKNYERQLQRDEQNAIRAQERAQREAERDAIRYENEQRQARERSARLMGDSLGNVVGQAVSANGGGSSSSMARNATKMATEAGMSDKGLNSAQTAGVGSAVGAAIGAVGGNAKNRGQNAAVGGLIGAVLGYGYSKLTEPATPQPSVNQNMREQGVVHRPGAVRGYEPAAHGAQQLVVYTAASMNLPPVMVEVANAARTGVVAPGQRPINLADEQALKSDPLLDRVIKSMANTSVQLADRASILTQLEELRVSGAALNETGRLSMNLAKSDRAARESMLVTMDSINKASAVGGYNTTAIWKITGDMVAEGYTQDARVRYQPNQQAGYNLR